MPLESGVKFLIKIDGLLFAGGLLHYTIEFIWVLVRFEPLESSKFSI